MSELTGYIMAFGLFTLIGVIIGIVLVAFGLLPLSEGVPAYEQAFEAGRTLQERYDQPEISKCTLDLWRCTDSIDTSKSPCTTKIIPFVNITQERPECYNYTCYNEEVYASPGVFVGGNRFEIPIYESEEECIKTLLEPKENDLVLMQLTCDPFNCTALYGIEVTTCDYKQ